MSYVSLVRSRTRLGALVAACGGFLVGLPSAQAADLVTVRAVGPEIARQTEPGGAAAGDVLVLSAAPRDSAKEGEQRFGPVADYLSKVLGRRVVYRHPTTWGGYEVDIQRDAYDIVFDGPHFVGWRIEKARHAALVTFPGQFAIATVVRKDAANFISMKSLAGRTFCTHAPPNLGTMVMYDAFDNPLRQPVVVVVDGYKEIFAALMAKKCDAAMLPVKHVKKFDPDGTRTRIVFQSRPMPEQALTVGPRITEAERSKLVQALLSPEADSALARVRKDYGLGQNFVAADSQQYVGLARYLKDMRGF